MGIPLPAKGVRRSNRGRSYDRRDVWVGPKPTERLQTSRGHRHWAKEIPRRKTLFGVGGGVRFKNDLTGPALLEMSGLCVTRALRPWYKAKADGQRSRQRLRTTRSRLVAISGEIGVRMALFDRTEFLYQKLAGTVYFSPAESSRSISGT